MATKMLLSCAITQRGTPKAVFCAKHVWIESGSCWLGFYSMYSQLTWACAMTWQGKLGEDKRENLASFAPARSAGVCITGTVVTRSRGQLFFTLCTRARPLGRGLALLGHVLLSMLPSSFAHTHHFTFFLRYLAAVAFLSSVALPGIAGPFGPPSSVPSNVFVRDHPRSFRHIYAAHRMMLLHRTQQDLVVVPAFPRRAVVWC
jgi:hypothetical protein